VLDQIGSGKKGKEIRENLKSAPYGWPQDAIDGALLIMLLAGNLRATVNGQPTQAQNLPQNQVGVATFYVDVPPLTVQQRLELKAVFQKAGVATQSGKESEAATLFLQKLLALADSAGGSAPRPASPDTQGVRALQLLSGNAQLLKIHEQKDHLTAKLGSWKKNTEGIAKRWPAWEQLLDFHSFAADLPEADECATSIAAITDGRTLLAEPDPVPELTKQLTTALRTALGKLQGDLSSAFQAGDARLAASHVWSRLSGDQRATLSTTCQLAPPAKETIGTDEEILAALRASTLAARRNFLDAVPQRFSRALDEASRLLEPKAQRVVLPAATIHNTTELDQWLAGARNQIEEKLKEGPVTL
jgi:hypothetical protein